MAVCVTLISLNIELSFILDDKLSGSFGGIIAGNIYINRIRFAAIKSCNTIYCKSSAPEGIFFFVIGHQRTGIADNIEDTVVRNVHVTELGKRILNVQRIPGSGHSCNFVILSVIAF